MTTPSPTIRECPARRALTLVEVVAATMIVGLMAIVTLGALGAATQSGQSAGNRAIGQTLASELMAEIIAAPYSDPDDDPVFGPEGAETAGPRNRFDDVDDYNGWNSGPPQYPDGTPLADRGDWRRQVTVELVQPDLPTQLTAGAADEGAKRVHVVVTYCNQVVAEQYFIRTDTE
jgi:Tfp pilus assembly protein PilV